MGKKDTITKEYMRDAETFADAFNFLLYDGQQVIKPEHLHELDITSIVQMYGDNANFYAMQKYRDILKFASAMADENMAYLILGIEDQTKIHYAMPVRNNLYDAIQYANQAEKIARAHRKAKNYGTSAEFLSGLHKGDMLKPVITLVIYWGADPWDAPRSLHEMLKTDDKRILSFVPDYRINLIAPNEIADEDLEKFHSDLSLVFRFMKYSKDKDKLRETIHKEHMFENVSVRTASLINNVAGLKLKINKRKDEVNMCKAVEDMIKDATSEAEKAKDEAERAKDEAEKAIEIERIARNEAEKKSVESLKRMLNSKKQFTFEEVAEIFGVSVEFVESVANGETA